MRLYDSRAFKPFPLNPGKVKRYFDDRANIKALEREIAGRIERNHDRFGWW